jgi:non-specific serine/threonine protein kinase
MSHFLGRAREIAEIRRLLENTRLLTLTGAGGSGKSRLALAVTGELVGTYAQGAWWAELAGLSNPALVPQTVAFALGVREQPGRAITETLSDYLCAKELLLVLDNCEHLLDACAQLAETLLRSCPRLHILATSRQALGLAGEIAWLVPGLAVPGAETRAATASEMLRALAETEAVQLFIDRAAGAQPGFRLTAANAAAVGQVCQRLDGLPLAIELAATWVKVLAVEEIACRLDDSLRLLTGGHRTALPRHQTLRATIDWSYVRLPPAEQTLLRRLSVFAGGFSLNAAETICADAQAVAVRAGPNGQPAVTPRDNVLGLLSNLVTKSLVDVQPADGETRYRLLETIRQYAEERLEESGEPERIRDRHTDFFLAFAEDAEPKLRSAQQAVWLQHLEAEHDNLRAALRRAATAGPVERALRLAAALAWFWYLHHDWREGRDWLVAILSRLPEGGPLPAAHGAASLGAGILCWIVGDHDSAASWLETSEALARQGGDRRGLAYARLYLGVVARTRSDHARSRALFNEAVALFRAVADPWGLGFALFCLGRATHGQGDNVTARACFEESLTCFRQTGDKWGLTLPFGGLAFVAQSQARYHEAAELLEQSIAIARELRDTQTVAWSLLSLGDVARCSGDYRRAGGLYGEALNLHRDLGLEYGIADTLQNLGWVALHDQDTARARACFEEALDLYQASGNQAALLQCVAGQAGVAVIQHRPTQAAQLFGAAEALLEALETVLAAAEQAEWTHYVAQARAMLSAEEFAAAWAEGRSLSLAQAIASAYPRDRAALGQQTRTARHAAAEIRRGPRYPAGLTAREVEVLGQVASGLTDAQVAQRLVISPRTVSTHLSAIYRKLGVTTRSEAAHFAAGHGLI